MATSGAFSVAKEVVRGGCLSRIVALGMPDDEAQVLTCARIGIAGYLTLDGSLEDVIATIKAAAIGEAHCSPKIAGSLFKHVATMSFDPPRRSGNGELTAREVQILRLVQEDMLGRTGGPSSGWPPAFW